MPGPGEPMTLTDLLATTQRWFTSKGIESARLDAELLLSSVLGMERIQLYTSFDRPISNEERDRFRALVRRRANREPIAYILGEREFFSRSFRVDPRVLIPRPDSETLVEAVLEHLPDDDTGILLDYGTGSGALALTLLAERTKLRALALDCSAEALEVARANAKALGLADRIGFIGSDGLRRIPERFLDGLCAIVANPPYIPLGDKDNLAPDVRDYEPHLALFPGADPLLHYRHLAEEAGKWLSEGGLLGLEVGMGQAQAVQEILVEQGWSSIQIRPDLAGIDRAILAVRPEKGKGAVGNK